MLATWDLNPNMVRRSDHANISHRYLDWGNLRADLVKRTGLKRQETRLLLNHHAFLINLQGDARMGEDFIDGRRVAFTPRKAGSVSFLPAGSEWSGWDEGDESGSYLLLRMRPEFAASTLGKDYSFEPTLGLRDAIVEGSLHRIVLELRSPDSASAIMVESQATQMLAQIVRLSGVRDEIAKGGFSPYDLRRVTELLESRLTDPPTAQELAAELGISRTHLFRAFRQSTGVTPYAFIADLRLRKAREFLQLSDRTATEIALECGFASSSHFAYAFKRVYGAGPLEYRRRWRL